MEGGRLKKRLKEELIRLNKNIEIDNADNEILEFLYQSMIVKKGYIFIYHESDFLQKYEFDIEPKIILSLKQFEDYKDLFVFDVHYKIVPLLLANGYFYKKLKRMTDLKVGLPLLNDNDDIKKLIDICRKKDSINIWMMHPTNQSKLKDNIKELLPDEDQLLTIDEKINFENNKKYHVVVLLMSEGNHYHQLLEMIPEYVSISKVLPLEFGVKEWIESRID